MYEIYLESKVEKIFSKLDNRQMNIITKKLEQISINPEHFKPLRGDMHGIRRVHIDKSFVLLFEIEGNIIRVIDYSHHDEVYD
jgi:mRNA interferase RelE/StbE/toxin YoeB